MKRYKKLIILGGVLVLCLIAVFVVTRINVYKEKISSTVETILEIDADTVTSLSWSYGDNALAFHKDEESSTDDEAVWTYDDDEAFPVDEVKISDLLYPFSEFTTEFTIDEVEDYGQYGLDDPMCVITIVTDDTTVEIKFGDYSTMDQERYVSIGDGKVYLATKDPTDDFDLELKDMIQDDDLPDFDEVSDVKFAGIENYDIYSDETGTLSWCEDDIYFTDVDGEAEAFDTTKVTKILNLIHGMDQSEYVTYNATDDELAQYGLDDPELTVTVNYVSETIEDEDDEDAEPEKVYSEFTISLSRSAEDKAAIEEAGESEEESGSDDEDAESYDGYVRVGDSQIIYKISAADFTSLTAVSYDDLRHDELFTADFDQVNKIDIELNGESYSFEKGTPESEEGDSEEDSETSTTAADEEESEEFCYDGEAISVLDFETALEAITYNGFTDTAADQDAEISLKLYLDNENFPEIDITLYRYDGSFCRAEVDGRMIGIVSRSSVVDLIETVNAIVLDGSEG